MVFDATPPASGAPGILAALIEGVDALHASVPTPADQRTAVLRVLTGYLGEAAAEPTDFLEEDWSAEEFTRGCYGAHLPPGAWTQVGSTLREPVGVMQWGGADTATR